MCFPATTGKPYLNLVICRGGGWEFSRPSSAIAFDSQFFPQCISFLSPFTINRKNKPGSPLNTLLGNVLISITKLITYSCTLRITSRDNFSKLSGTTNQVSPFLQFPTCSFSSETSLSSVIKSRFLLTISSGKFRFSLSCFSKFVQSPPTLWYFSVTCTVNLLLHQIYWCTYKNWKCIIHFTSYEVTASFLSCQSKSKFLNLLK